MSEDNTNGDISKMKRRDKMLRTASIAMLVNYCI